MTGSTEARKRVLIVDDSSTMRALLDGILSNDRGFLVVGLARSAKEAVMMLHPTRPQIILTDLCMPEMDGSELLAMLEGRTALCKIVVSTSANLSEEVEQKLTALGASAIFDKQEIARDPKAFLASLHRAVKKGAPAKSQDPARQAIGENVIMAAARFPTPSDEAARARAVRSLNIANLDVDPRLNILVRHLARLSNYPIAAVNIIGSDQLWVKAAVGTVPAVVSRGDSICAHSICAEGVTVIVDTLADPRFCTLPAVIGGPRLRSYLGAPIVSAKGARLGMVCVADTRPRHPTREELDVVADVAALVASSLQMPLALRSAA